MPRARAAHVFVVMPAYRIADKLEMHHTPKRGSWLEMAEPRWSVLSRQCLDRRIADRATSEREVAAWLRDHQAKPI